jgi:DNA-binding NarL/FixJ family response regulator
MRLPAAVLLYLTKDAGTEEIRRALEAVVGGEVALDPAVQRHLVDALAYAYRHHLVP